MYHIFDFTVSTHLPALIIMHLLESSIFASNEYEDKSKGMELADRQTDLSSNTIWNPFKYLTELVCCDEMKRKWLQRFQIVFENPGLTDKQNINCNSDHLNKIPDVGIECDLYRAHRDSGERHNKQ